MSRENALIHAMGLPATRAEMTGDAFRTPVNQEDAARYLDAFALLQAKEVAPLYWSIRQRAEDQAQEKPFSAKTLADMRKYLRRYEGALEKLEAAMQRPIYRYPAEVKKDTDPEHTRVQGAQQAIHHFYMIAVLAAERGDPEEACQALLGMMTLIDSLREEYADAAPFARRGALELAQNGLRHALALVSFSEDQLAALSRAWTEAEEPLDVVRMLAAQRLDELRAYRFPQIVMGRFNEKWGYFDRYVPQVTYRALLATEYLGWNVGDKIVFLRAMRRLMTIMRKPWPEALPLLGEMEKDFPPPRHSFREYVPRMSTRIMSQQIHYTSFFLALALGQRLTVTALALERFRLRYGQYPPDLDALVPEFLPSVPGDLVDGAPLRYCFTASGCAVYSISMDHVDGGGVATPFGVYWASAGDLVFELNPPEADSTLRECL